MKSCKDRLAMISDHNAYTMWTFSSKRIIPCAKVGHQVIASAGNTFYSVLNKGDIVTHAIARTIRDHT